MLTADTKHYVPKPFFLLIFFSILPMRLVTPLAKTVSIRVCIPSV